MKAKETVLVTGATGFVGYSLCSNLIGSKAVRAAVRDSANFNFSGAVDVVRCQLSPYFDWAGLLSGVDQVVHCAARVHVMKEKAADPYAEFRSVNVDGTLGLARQAAEAGVRRFVFISSIGVNGGETTTRPFTADDSVYPHTPYALSKYEAEVGLRAIAEGTAMEIVIIRAPLVYGPNAPGNFLSLMNFLASRVPLPLGAVNANRRSFVYLDNLIDLIVTCLGHPNAANQTFLVSDGEDLSTTDLLRRMGHVLGKPARLITVPQQLLTLGARVLGKPGVAQRLCGSLQVDITKTRELLGWSPSVSVDEGLRRTAVHWLATHS
jgi:nucleoside-diphosphate-sugar epimerase